MSKVPLSTCVNGLGESKIGSSLAVLDSVAVPARWVVREGGDDGELRPWHCIYVYSIERRLMTRVRYDSLIPGSIHHEYEFP